jgi:ribose transport system permease protein
METAAQRIRPRFQFGLEVLYRFSRILFVAILSVVMGIVAPGFWRVTNALNILRQASLVGILGIGQTIVILTGGIDLSVGTVATLAAIATTWMLERGGFPVWLTVICGTLIGGAAGLANGFMRAYIGLPPFVATYGTMWVAIGFAVVILGGYIIYGFEPGFRILGIGRVLGVPTPIWMTAVLAIVVWFLLRRTVFGRKVYATGANTETARLSGIDVKRVITQAHVLCGLLAGFGGVVVAALLNSSEAGMADKMLLPSIAAVVVGGTSMRGGEGGIGGTLIGAVIMTLVVNAMNLLGVSSNWQQPVQGFVILAAVLLDQWGRRRFRQE